MKEVQFNQLAAEGYNRIPVTLETFSDLDTPLSIYLKLANAQCQTLLEKWAEPFCSAAAWAGLSEA